MLHKKCPLHDLSVAGGKQNWDYESSLGGGDESDFDPRRRSNVLLPRYRNFGNRACAHRGQCYTPADWTIENSGSIGNSSLALTRPPIKSTLLSSASKFDAKPDFLRSESVKMAYAIPLEEYQMGLYQQDRFSAKQRAIRRTSPLVYHSAVQTTMPDDFLELQDPKLHSDISPVIQKCINVEENGWLHKEVNPEIHLGNLRKARKTKKGLCVKKTSTTKWKKTVYDAVKNRKNESVGLILFGPEGPEYYSKIGKCRDKPLKRSASCSDLGVSDRRTMGKDSGFSQLATRGDGDTGADVRDKSECDRNDRASSRRSRGQSSDTKQSDIDKKPHKNQAEYKNHIDEKNEETSKKQSFETVPRKNFLDFSDWTLKKENEMKSRNVFRSTVPESVSKRSCSTLVSDGAMTQVECWLKDGSDRSKNKNEKEANKDQKKEAKDEISSSLDRPKDNQLDQLKKYISSYLDYLEEKSESDGNQRTDDTGVSVECGTLIAAVDNPLHEIASDVTVNVTRSVTDALVATDEQAAGSSLLALLRKMRGEYFRKVIGEVQQLQQIVQFIDTFSKTKRKRSLKISS